MGRPREFDIDKALDTASELFWHKGYEGTSLSDLTGAIGITPPSFYSAFKSKEGALQTSGRPLPMRSSRLFCGGPQPNDTVSRRGAGALRLGGRLYDKATSPGCLVLNCSLPYSDDTEDSIRHDLAERKEGEPDRVAEAV